MRTEAADYNSMSAPGVIAVSGEPAKVLDEGGKVVKLSPKDVLPKSRSSDSKPVCQTTFLDYRRCNFPLVQIRELFRDQCQYDESIKRTLSV